MRAREQVSAAARLCAVAAWLLAASACERADDEGSQAERASGGSTQPAGTKAKDPLADMVSAVTSARQSAPVELKFAIQARPEVGRPLEVAIAVLPVSPLNRVSANFQAGPGLELRSGDAIAAVEQPEPDVPILHRLTIVPQRDGIFFISAVVHADSKEQLLTRTFSIPIIAGRGQPAAPPERPDERSGEGAPR